jgi:hypothetical protein
MHIVSENIEQDAADDTDDSCHKDKNPVDSRVVVACLFGVQPFPVEDVSKD